MTKAQKVTALVFSCVFALISMVLIFWYFGENYSAFYSRSSKEFAIPGLNEGYTPQGLCYEENSNLFLTCGYMKNGSASRVYVIDEANNETKFFTLKDGQKNYLGHAGGIATDGINVWIAGDGKVSRFAFNEVLTVENGGQIKIIDSFESGNGADFVTVENGSLWVGEFHREGKYDTDQTHFVELLDGKINKAISFKFEINASKDYGLKSTTPVLALSTPSLVQGMVVTDEKIVLSTSYSLPNSNIFIYYNIMDANTHEYRYFDYAGTKIQMFILEDKDLAETIQAPCMSEEIELVGNKIYVMFESACEKYSFITREPLRNVYSFTI